MSLSFDAQNKMYLDHIEKYLSEECFQYPSEPQKVLFEAMRYSLLAGGKRIRPILTLDFCRMCGGNWENAIAFACAVEMIHTYSLIHDDLPCMDDDDYRRGLPTNHKVFGEAIAVLSGDALLTAAFSAIAKSSHSAAIRIRAVEILSECAGELGMVGGQVLDMQSEQRQCTPDEVIAIQSRKTGALIKASCMLGVLAADGSDTQLNAAADFADHLGLAFQIRDDILDVVGDAKKLGKAVGTDANKNTFVQLYGLEKCNVLVNDHTEQALDALAVFEESGFMSALAKSLTDRIS